MKKVWIVCAVMVALASGLSLSAMAEEQQSVAGRWQVQYIGTSDRGGRFDAEMTLKLDGEQITGTWSNPQNRVTDLPVTGTFKGDTLSLDSVGERSSPGWLTAQISGDKMTGKIRLRAGPLRDITGTRVK
jgi:hypothetical protein